MLTDKQKKIFKTIGLPAGIIAVGAGAGMVLGKYFKVHPKLHASLILSGITITAILAVLVDNIWHDTAFPADPNKTK